MCSIGWIRYQYINKSSKTGQFVYKKDTTPTPLLVRKNGRLKTAHYWKFTLYKSSNSANFH